MGKIQNIEDIKNVQVFGESRPDQRIFRVATIRENQGKIWPSGKSGNFNILCRESGKVRENNLAEVTQSLSLISRHIFCKKNPVVAGAKFFLASLEISCDTHQICVVRSGKVREGCAEKVRESQGIQIELTGGNPDFLQSFIKMEKFLGEANFTFTLFKFPILFSRKYKNVNVKFASHRNVYIFMKHCRKSFSQVYFHQILAPFLYLQYSWFSA